MIADHEARMERARLALTGLSVGDAFGERFFGPVEKVATWLSRRDIDHPGPWRWTDDTAMAIALVDTLEHARSADPDDFITRLIARHKAEPWRGYGHGAHHLFETIATGVPWRSAVRDLFGGQGSFGNGAAMRVAPLGAYFAEDSFAVIVDEARRSAEVTHAHFEGQAGAIAIALAAAAIWRTRTQSEDEARAALWSMVLDHTPDSRTRHRIEEARMTAPETAITEVAERLGNGSQISSQDTVPLCMWAIAKHPRDFEAALWTTVAALGDRDTTCAIVGGVVALADAGRSIPASFLERREPLEGIPLERLALTLG
jgi:ADP-ribosylglycohydrolase